MKKSLLYVINFYGSPPLNYFEKYIKETDSANLTILKLPAVRSAKGRLMIDAFIKDESGKTHPLTINIPFPLPYFSLFLLQYVFNFVIMFILLQKIKRQQFDIAIGETNYGSAMVYLLKMIGKVKFAVFMNGDILPDTHSSRLNFYLPNSRSRMAPFIKYLDSFIVRVQSLLRKIGYKNDLIWYGNEAIYKWDIARSYKPHAHIIEDPIMISYASYLTYAKERKHMNIIGYIGRLDDFVGLDIIIPAIALIRKKIPDIHFAIIGGNAVTVEKYAHIARKHHVEQLVKFHGYVPQMEDALLMLSRCAMGMALYKPDPANVSMVAQPAKPRDYIQVGLPVLLTDQGPAIGKEIVERGAGIACEFNTESVAETIIKVLTDQTIYQRMIRHVGEYAKDYDYLNRFPQIWHAIESRYDKSNTIDSR